MNTDMDIYIWATWCRPCIEHIKKWNDENFKILESKNTIFICVDSDFDDWKKASTNLSLDKNENNYFSNGNTMKDLYNIYSLPTYLRLSGENDEAEKLSMLEGIVLDKKGNPIENVKIYSGNKNYVSKSNENGYFFSALKPEINSFSFQKDGYHELVIDGKSLFSSSLQIVLENNNKQLNTVSVYDYDHTKIKRITIGQTKHSSLLKGNVWKNAGDDDAEAAKLFNEKSDKIKLQNASIFIKNDSKKPLSLKLNIYNLDSSSGFPGNKISSIDFKIMSSINEGWIDIDLSNEVTHIFEKPFFIAIQWPSESGEIQYPYFGLYGGDGYLRLSPTGNWEKSKNHNWVIKAEAYKFK